MASEQNDAVEALLSACIEVNKLPMPLQDATAQRFLEEHPLEMVLR